MTENMDSICPEEAKCVDEEALPSALEMARNLLRDSTKIVSNAIQGNSTLVDQDLRDSRWNVCLVCPRLQNDRCLECGCFMKVKVAFQTSVCPLGKW
jgi:hypothetical protein